MKQRKICASCLQENEPQTLVCVNCGMPFQYDVRTPNMAVELRNDPFTTQEIERSLKKQPPPNMLALYVVSDSNPILIPFEKPKTLILGRDMPEGNFVAVNLSNYSAQALGVSRQHATIRITEEGCVVEDLNSTNGTHIGEVRLEPGKARLLQRDDEIRIGALNLRVLF